MNSSSFLRADGTLDRQGTAWWSPWLPSLSQVRQAIQLRFDTAPKRSELELSIPSTNTFTNVWALTMRQGLGLVIVAALLAGFLPFLINTVTAIRLGTVLPFIELAQQAQRAEGAPPSPLDQAFETLASLSPAVLPPWLAALLSTIGEWINWPLRWLTWWLVYGTAVLLAAKGWGAPTTLQRFLAVTSYAAVPMIVSGLGPIPCLGVLAQIVAVVWMLAVYTTGVRVVTGLDWGRAAVAVILPAAVVSLIGFTLLLAAASTVLRMIF
jgi:hypothetical protein